ncbi:MAG TPA: DUF1902 domain-containing protein [Nitrococcus sp.]|nr:DUF1902 domain-containing protein [Nitrococcus sp.]
MPHIRIKAVWDPEAEVWVAESEDVPGLVTEADTIEALTDKLRVLIPELLEANGITPVTDNHSLSFDLFAERHDSIRLSG